MHDFSKSFTLLFKFDANNDGNALLDVKNVFVRLPFWGDFFLLRVSMEIQNPYPVKRLKKMPAHATEGRVI
ncbi:hypothetical protein AGR5A_pa50030 [Agrobacterium genomosp. 5 str. CFBP 6626]|nr:hypothetical protein AGR5A_pa50030 [Agrobacterium genomosp. 5 str. CFBP 6626]